MSPSTMAIIWIRTFVQLCYLWIKMRRLVLILFVSTLPHQSSCERASIKGYYKFTCKALEDVRSSPATSIELMALSRYPAVEGHSSFSSINSIRSLKLKINLILLLNYNSSLHLYATTIEVHLSKMFACFHCIVTCMHSHLAVIHRHWLGLQYHHHH